MTSPVHQVTTEPMESQEFSQEALPTQGGTFHAWRPEYQSGNTDLSADGWLPVPIRKARDGVPGDRVTDGIAGSISMCSYAQAQALAWAFAAEREYETGKPVEVRAAEYRLHYDIKAYRRLA